MQTHRALPSSPLRRLQSLPFEVVTALLSVRAGVLGVLGGATVGPIAEVSPFPLGYAWFISYAISGVLVLVGLTFARPSIETAGLIWLAGGIAINMLASVQFAAVNGWTLTPQALFLLACLVRAAVLLKHADVLLAEPTEVT